MNVNTYNNDTQRNTKKIRAKFFPQLLYTQFLCSPTGCDDESWGLWSAFSERGAVKNKKKKVVKCEFIIIRLNEAKQNIKRNKDKIYNNKYKIFLKQKRLVLNRKILQAFFNNNFKKVCKK